MLGLCTIVIEGSKEFELNCPLPRNNQIALLPTTWVALWRSINIVGRSRAPLKVLKRSVHSICFNERADARSIGSGSRGPLRARLIYCLEGTCEVADDIT